MGDFIQFTETDAQEKCPPRAGGWRSRTGDGETLVFLTNHLTFGATTIAQI